MSPGPDKDGTTSDQKIVDEALKQPAESRVDFVRKTCGSSGAQMDRVMRMLGAHGADLGIFDSAPTGGATEDDLPDTIDSYRILERIGEGGMGWVYLAEQTEPVRRRVALKVIKPGMATREVIGRFESERQALALMNHPNITRILDAGSTEDGRPYFVLEYVAGVSIVEYCDSKKIGIEGRLKLFLDVCGAVEHAHQRGIIHRDIKPSNILVTEEDRKTLVKVIDFGIAKATNQRLSDLTVHTRIDSFIGTPQYMSPEQAVMSALEVDTRSDVYSLGAVLYMLLVGVPPLALDEEDSLAGIQRAIQEEDPKPPSALVAGELAYEAADKRGMDAEALRRSIQDDLDWIAMKALDKDRARRYSFPSELAADIRRHLEHQPVVAGPPSALYRMSKFVQRNRVGVRVAGLVLIMVAAGAWAAWGWWRASNRAEQAQRFGQDVASLEWKLRVEQMSPLHDLTPEYRRIEARLDEIGTDMSDLGPAARAPGNYALGRGQLALDRIDEAVVHLNAAWREGLQTPEVAFARGVALGQVYSREIDLARAVVDEAARQRRIDEARARYRDPALEALGQASSAAAAPLSYVKALIAVYEERFDDAFVHVDAALAEAPWLWEAHDLRADAHQHRAEQFADASEPSGSEAALDAAQAAYKAAIDVAPSAPDPYRGLCEQGVFRMFLSQTDGTTEDEFVKLRAETEDACEAMTVIAPNHPELPALLASFYIQAVQHQIVQGKALGGEFELAREYAQKAILQRPDSPSAQFVLGDFLLKHGRYLWERGEDAREVFEEAAGYLTKAAELDPWTRAANNAANALLLKGRQERSRRVNPTESFERAMAMYRRAAELAPENVLTQGNICLVMQDLAQWEKGHGIDPRPRLLAAADLLSAQIDKAPEIAFLHSVMTWLTAEIARVEAIWGDDDSVAWLERGKREAETTIRLQPETPGSYFASMQVDLETARRQIRHGQDPGEAIARGYRRINRGIELFANQPKAYRGRAELADAEARWAIANGRDPEPFIAKGLVDLATAMRLQADDESMVLPIQAKLQLLRLENASSDAAARRELSALVHTAERLEALGSDIAESLFLAGHLRVWQGRLARNGREAQAASNAADALFAQALEINPALKGDVDAVQGN